MNTRTPLLELRGISKRFGVTEALSQVTMTVMSGEVIAIVGDNGAGKTTLINVMIGMVQPDEGTLFYDGEEVTIPSIHQANAMGIAAVFQHQEFCENLDVSANLFLGNEPRMRAILRDDMSMVGAARKALASLTATIRPSQSIASLSGGQRQTVAIARTLLSDPRIIAMDEPTSSLSVIQTAEVMDYIKRLRAQGCSIVLICHDLPDVFAIADRIVVMRHGRIVNTHNTRDTTYEQIIAEISGVQGNDENHTTRKIRRRMDGSPIQRRPASTQP